MCLSSVQKQISGRIRDLETLIHILALALINNIILENLCSLYGSLFFQLKNQQAVLYGSIAPFNYYILYLQKKAEILLLPPI